MSKAYAFIRNTTAQAFAVATGNVNPGAGVHGYGSIGCGNCCKYIIEANQSNISLNECGYYNISVGVNASASAAGNVTVSLLQDGQVLATGSEAVAAANGPVNINFPAGAKVNCSSVLTLQVTASAGTPIVNGVYITIEKIR